MQPMYRTRRELLGSVASAFAMIQVRAGPLAVGASPGPLLWLASKGHAKVYLFPIGEARDRSWFNRKVEEAFGHSSELWLELGAPPTKKRLNDLYAELGHEPHGRTFFDSLDPKTKARALRYTEELGISRESVAPLRPWLAYYTFVTAFDEKFGHSEGFTKSGPEQTPPEYVLAGEAFRDRKSIHVEFTMEAWLRKLASMSDHLQSEYLEWLFDWFEDERKGLNRDNFDWMKGHLVSRTIIRMRRHYPGLYEVMDGERNRWWARQIGKLIGKGGTYFVAVGQDHFADPQGIQTQLLKLGVVTSSELRLV
jgi:uncharacterized protein YbaP (TraB family)